jgi:hypothetical protein
VPDLEQVGEAEVRRIRDELDLFVADLLATAYPDSDGQGSTGESGARQCPRGAAEGSGPRI